MLQTIKAGEDLKSGDAVVIGIDGKAYKFNRGKLEQSLQEVIAEAFSAKYILGPNAEQLTDAQRAQKIYDYRFGVGAADARP